MEALREESRGTLKRLFQRGPELVFTRVAEGGTRAVVAWEINPNVVHEGGRGFPVRYDLEFILEVQMIRALVAEEPISRCRECDGAFIYQEPRPGVSGKTRRRAAEFCTWQHAKRFGARQRRRKGARA